MTSFLDKGSFAAIFIALMLMPLVSHAGGLGVAPLIFILGVLGWFLAFKTKKLQITPVLIALVLFLLWLCLTSLWSPYKPDDLLTNYIKLAIMALAFLGAVPLFEYAGRRRPRRLQHLFMSTAFFTVGLLIIDLMAKFGLTLAFNPPADFNERILRIIDAEMNLGHSITILLLIAAPAALLMRARLPNRFARPVMMCFLLLLAIAAWLNGLAVGLLGLLGVIAAAIAGYIFPRRVPQLLLGLAIALICLAPAIAFSSSYYLSLGETNLPTSWDHRLRMWAYCWDVIASRPIKGAGFDASRTFSETFIARDGREIVTVSLHPHNAGIQIWTEAGAIGAVLASAVIAALFKPVKSFVHSRGHAGAVCGVIMGTIIVSSLTYGAWQFWWWGSVFFAVGTLYLLPSPKRVIPLQDNQWMD